MATTTLQLYKYTGPLNTINKTLPTPTKKTGTQVEPPQSVLECDFIITGTTIPEYNYVYVSTFKRYYFITDCLWLGGNAFQIHLKCDVLYTNKTKIDALTAMIKYSVLGSPLEHDTRLNFQDQTTIDETLNTSILSSLTPWVAIRYWSLSEKYDPNAPVYTGTTNIKCIIMTVAAFQRFVEQMMTNNVVNETDRVIFCQAIVDVNIVYHTIDIAANYQYAGISQTQEITLQTPKNKITYRFLTGTGQYMYLIDKEDQLQYLQKIEYQGPSIPEAVDWYLTAKYTIEIPFCGVFSIVPSEAGIKKAAPLYWEISTDWLAGNYLVTPCLGDNNNPLYREPLTHLQKLVPIPTKTTLPADFALDNFNSSILNGHMGELGRIMNLNHGVSNPMLSIVDKKMNAYLSDNMSYELKGGYGQYTPYVPYGVEGIRTCVAVVLPDTDTATFWANWGYPDHEVRSISAITDGTWFQCEAVDMRSFSTITQTEVDEIERLLLSGVYA